MKKKLLLIAFLSINIAVVKSQVNASALYFDGVDDKVVVAGASALTSGSSHVSMSMWVSPDNANPVYPDFDGFAGFRNNSDCDFYIVQIAPTQIEARFRNSTGANFDITYNGLVLHSWNHFVLTYDGAQMILYQNGLQVAAVAATGTFTTNSADFLIGDLKYSINDFYLLGKMDEIALWNRTLSPDDVQCVHNNSVSLADPDLLLYYRCNEGTPEANNVGVSALYDEAMNINGAFTGFAFMGTTSNYVAGTADYYAATDDICPGAEYQIGGQVFNSPGTYYVTLQGSNGCDSSIVLTLNAISFDTTVTLTAGTISAVQQNGATYQWYTCQNGNISPIQNQTQSSYTPTQSGTYAVIITFNGCVYQSPCIPVTISAVDNLGLKEVKIFPNPASGKIQLNLSESRIGNIIAIYNILGEILIETKATATQMEIDISNLLNGMYIIQIADVKPLLLVVEN